MGEMAKLLMVTGSLVFGLGALLLLASKVPGVGRLPGDILIKRENFTFYFPIMSSIIISIFLSFLFFVFNRR